MKSKHWLNNYEEFNFDKSIENYYNEGRNMKNSFGFLKSNRFWALVIGAVALYLKSKGIFGEAEMMLVATITAGFTIIRTADRVSEQKVVAAGVTSGQVEASQAVNIPPKE